MGRPLEERLQLKAHAAVATDTSTKAAGAVDPEDEVEMTFFDHLRELRSRLVKAAAGVILGASLGWIYREPIMAFLKSPLRQAYARLGMGDATLHFTDPIEPFVANLRIAVAAGVIIGSPWIFYQLWQFVAPGLYRRERRLAIPFVIASTVFFAGGAIFGYSLVLPAAYELFLGFASSTDASGPVDIVPMITLSNYLDFSTRLLVAFGVTFEVPVVVTFLALAGIVNWKQLLNFGRWWLVIAAVIAAVLTPPDVGSQMMMLVPLIVLYYLSVILAYFFGPTPPPETKDSDEPEVEPAS